MSWMDAYRGRRVLVTGHTGFKGSWLSLWLAELGAQVHGFALPPATDPNLFQAARVADRICHDQGDIRDLRALDRVWRQSQPEIVFHLAAQPIVRESYRDPLGTVQTNVLGTVHVLELARAWERPLAVVIVTSDKCYENREWIYGYREIDPMGGHDVYSASKGAAEILVSAWRRSFAGDGSRLAIASVRAGNVIGGGDWAADRIIPDTMRSLVAGQPVRVRNPNAVRPWQHVLEPLSGYLILGSRLLGPSPGKLADAWNFGPRADNARSVRDVVEQALREWGSGRWEDVSQPGALHEAGLLHLSIDKAQACLSWRPRWDFAATIRQTISWYRSFHAGEDAQVLCRRQIAAYVDGGPR